MSETVEVGFGVRRRRSLAEAKRLVLEFEQSGLTRQAFCAQHGLSVPALDQYRKRCRDVRHASPISQGAPPFARRQASAAGVVNPILPVELVESSACSSEPALMSSRVLRVELANGRRIEVGHGFDASTLERLLAVLEKA